MLQIPRPTILSITQSLAMVMATLVEPSLGASLPTLPTTDGSTLMVRILICQLKITPDPAGAISRMVVPQTPGRS
ncbi:hypothetical protein BKA61DRAFT_604596 [Leptodontidium sp. MPI-SDFR-AT-0119]|nr:hypothetical protein BKA61DRAFT_604596 [Leptodontidium sp. MPI-SDFR-AT-0119]